MKKDNNRLHWEPLHILWLSLRIENLDIISRGIRFKGESGTLNKDIAEIERMLKAFIKSLENKPLNPWPWNPRILFSN